MDNAQKFALKKYPVKVFRNEKPIDVNAPRRREAEQIYREAEKEIIEKAAKWFMDHIDINQEVETTENGEPLALSYIAYAKARLEAANKIIDEFKKAMED